MPTFKIFFLKKGRSEQEKESKTANQKLRKYRDIHRMGSYPPVINNLGVSGR